MVYLIGYGLVILGFADFGLSLFGIDNCSGFGLPDAVSHLSPLIEHSVG